MSVVTLTKAAAEKIQQLQARDDREAFGLRVKVIGGGCSGLQYQLMFEPEAGDWDQELVQNGVRVLIDSKSAVYLAGATIDFVDDLTGSGFKIENPNATSTCGCGQSFGA
jgi:iron-sulfur cluster assembly accessory protein